MCVFSAGPSLIQQLLDDFLFRASRIILNTSDPASSSPPSHDFHPKCSTASSRLAAYEVLVMLADSSVANLQLITRELLSMHHQSDPSLSKEFDVSRTHFCSHAHAHTQMGVTVHQTRVLVRFAFTFHNVPVVVCCDWIVMLGLKFPL